MQCKMLTGLCGAALVTAMLINPVLAESSTQNITQVSSSNGTQSVRQQSIHIGVIGEVQVPGAYFLTSEVETDKGAAVQQIPTVLRAIQAARGITPAADVRQVQVRRQTPNGTTQIINVDLFKYLQYSDTSQDIGLQEGDVVVVPFAQ